ncbi:MAG: hydroxymethylbilane synthase [Myxococcota bacterium]|jgi:hydroxymethylbilane synthase|nr:hydroxymethylbilane synthase [Myxococcota bacterium]
MSRIIRIGTRASRLALWQAQELAGQLKHCWPELRFELVEVSTQGDRIVDKPLALIGGKGLFVKELELALLDGIIDMAAHSAKDLPGEMPEGLCLGAVLPRESAADVLVSRGLSLAELPERARIGTSSLRRKAMLLRLRPDLDVINLRGNLDTRLRKLNDAEDGLQGAVLAYAGMRRLGFERMITQILSFDDFVPAPGQGIIAVQTRSDDPEIEAILAPVHHHPSADELAAERAFLSTIEGSCHLPIGALAWHEHGVLRLFARIVSPDGCRTIDHAADAPPEQAVQLGRSVARQLSALGAAGIIASIRGAGPDASGLAGLPVIVTKAANRADVFEQELSAHGGTPICIPTIDFEPIPDAPLLNTFAMIEKGSYRWCIFTSPNGVDFTWTLSPIAPTMALESAWKHGREVRIAAIGDATADALRARGVPVHLVPPEYTAEGLLAALQEAGIVVGTRCVLFTAERHRGVLEAGLKEAGAQLDEVAVYRTFPAPDLSQRLREALDVKPKGYIAFASGSAVESFVAAFGDDALGAIRDWRIAVIGPATAARARELGLPVHVVAPQSTLHDFAAAMAQDASAQNSR